MSLQHTTNAMRENSVGVGQCPAPTEFIYQECSPAYGTLVFFMRSTPPLA